MLATEIKDHVQVQQFQDVTFVCTPRANATLSSSNSSISWYANQYSSYYRLIARCSNVQGNCTIYGRPYIHSWSNNWKNITVRMDKKITAVKCRDDQGTIAQWNTTVVGK